MIKNCSLKKYMSKTALLKRHLNIGPSKKKALRKNILKLLPQKIYFKNTCQIAITKIFFINAFINAVKSKTGISKCLIIYN